MLELSFSPETWTQHWIPTHVENEKRWIKWTIFFVVIEKSLFVLPELVVNTNATITKKANTWDSTPLCVGKTEWWTVDFPPSILFFSKVTFPIFTLASLFLWCLYTHTMFINFLVVLVFFNWIYTLEWSYAMSFRQFKGFAIHQRVLDAMN